MSGTDDSEPADGDRIDGDSADDGHASASEPVQVTGTAADDDAAGSEAQPAAGEEEFGWRGYVLLGVIVVAFVIAPIVVFLRPPALPRYVSLIIFPLLPAVALGAVAVWSAAQS